MSVHRERNDPQRDMTIVRVDRVVRLEGPRWWVRSVLSRRVTGRMKMGEDRLIGEYVEEISISAEVELYKRG
jgi:hypothetical protein